MIEKIKETIKNNPNNIAYIFNNEQITYQELYKESLKYANYLKRQDSKVIILYNKGLKLIISILACILANKTYIPLDSKIPINRLKTIIDETNTKLVLTDQMIDGINTTKLEELIKYKNNNIIKNNNKIAYIIFTSGSTGSPKGVPISYANLNNFINWISNIKPFSNYTNINILNTANFSFDLSVTDLFYSLSNSHTLISIDNLDDKIFAIIKDIDVIVSVPTFIKYCLLNKDFNNTNYPKLKCLYFCGEQLEKRVVEKIYEVFPNIEIINAYGPTEATSAVSYININKDILNKYDLLPVGKVGDFATDIQIIDNEIVLKGESVFNGYLNNIKGGYYKENNTNCYKTGDIGFIKDNYLFCKGRKDNQIKYKGYRIELEEIETNLKNIEGIIDCAVIAKYNDNNIVKNIKAFVISPTLTIQDIKEELNKTLPSYMIPNSFKIIDKLPTNSNGKIDRKALKEL